VENSKLTTEDIQEALKGFIQAALSLEDVESYVIVAVDKKNNVKQHNFGHDLLIYGMLDFVKRQMFVRMGESTCSRNIQRLKEFDEKTAAYANEVSKTLEMGLNDKDGTRKED